MATPALHTLAFIYPNLYKDSVALMRVAQRLLALPGVVNATLQMGNPANKEILQEAGLLGAEAASAGPSDIMVVVQARTLAACKAALNESKAQLAGQGAVAGSSASQTVVARNLAMGLAQMGSVNIVQISVPGLYAAAEALKAVKQGRNVFMFSDNVPIEQEVEIKREATQRGVLVMGPDCGTAIIGGVPLGFANNVRRGAIGVVAASGTGLQEVSTQIHRMGGGISHAIGTGGRDVYAQVGGATLLQGIALLASDTGTQLIAVVCKPPAPDVAVKVMAALQAAGKPAVVLFLGSAVRSPSAKIRVVHTLVDCAAQCVAMTQKNAKAADAAVVGGVCLYAMPRKPAFASGQRYIRALYSGGTYCSEAQIIWAQQGVQVWSNVPLDGSRELANPKLASREHTALDLGDDAFTVGRPHPMIDQAARIERLLQEAADPTVRVLVLDVVIGWGAHADPASELAVAIVQAKRIAAQGQRHLAVIGFVCGTELDPQVLSQQEAKLRAAGMVLAGNSANAAWLAARWVL